MELGGASQLLETMNPFLPDWGSHGCNRNREPNQWEGKGYITLEACCIEHFEWKVNDCMGIDSEDDDDDDDDDDDGDDDNDNDDDE